MATGGWGGAGAWQTGSKPQAHTYDPDLDEGPAAAYQPAPAAPLYSSQQQPSASTFGGGFAAAFQPSGGTSARFNGAAEATVPAGAGVGGGLAAREAALAQKEKELAEKEKKLKSLEQDLVASGAVIKRKNWPIFPKLIYHSIADEIPDKSKRVVREVYLCWWGLVVCLLYNFFCASVMLGTGESQRVPSWFLAVIYAVLGIPISFWLWYFRIYRAARDDSTLGFWAFLCGFAIHCGFCIWAAIAVPFSSEAWSFAGWVTAMVALSVGMFPGVVYIIGSCLWTLEALYCLWCAKDAYLFFRGKGGVQQAKQEAALAAFRMQQQGGGV